MALRGQAVSYSRHQYRYTPHGDQYEIEVQPYASIGLDAGLKVYLTPVQFAEHLVEKFGWCFDQYAGPQDMADDLATVVADIRQHRVTYGGAHTVAMP